MGPHQVARAARRVARRVVYLDVQPTEAQDCAIAGAPVHFRRDNPRGIFVPDFPAAGPQDLCRVRRADQLHAHLAEAVRTQRMIHVAVREERVSDVLYLPAQPRDAPQYLRFAHAGSVTHPGSGRVMKDRKS